MKTKNWKRIPGCYSLALAAVLLVFVVVAALHSPKIIVSSSVNLDGMTEITVREINSVALREYTTNLSKHYSPATLPNADIKRWEAYKFGAFISFNTQQFTGRELCRTADPQIYQPIELDVENWIDAIDLAGMKYAILTTRSTSGFLLWDSPTTYDDVGSSQNKTDVVQAFTDECRKHNITPGLYYGMWGGEWKKHSQAREIILAQLFELATKYGDIEYFFIDMLNWLPDNLPPQEIYDLLKSLQPETIVLMNQHIQDGTRIRHFPTDVLNGEMTLPPISGHERYREVAGKKYYLPFEFEPVSQRAYGKAVGITPFGPGCWFTYGGGRSFPESTPFLAEQLHSWIKDAYSRGASNVLLSLAPDHTGKMRSIDVEQLRRLGILLKEDL